MPTRSGHKERKQQTRTSHREEPKSNKQTGARRNDNDDYGWFDQYDPISDDDNYEVDNLENEIYRTDVKGKNHNKPVTRFKPQFDKPRSISPSDKTVFDRCQQPIEFMDDRDEQISPLVNDYAATVRARFNINFTQPGNHTSVKQYEKCVSTANQIPYYKKPALNIEFPDYKPKAVFIQRNVSLLPILISAHRNNVNIFQYDIISERNSFRKIAMNNSDYVIGVEKIGRTLFLRRYDNRITNLNDQGHRFEQMCTVDYNGDASYHHLIEGNIGSLKTLISAETDAVDQVTGQAIELKSRLNSNIIRDPGDCWLQAFLGGVSQVIVGTCTDSKPIKLVAVHQQNVTELVNNETKQGVLRFLYQVLCFLHHHVESDTTYLFSRRFEQRNGRHGLHLYKVTNRDKHEMSFISRQMLLEIGFLI